MSKRPKAGPELMREMRATGIHLADDGSALRFRCKTCAQSWTSRWEGGHEAIRGWWRCPDGCNSDAVRPSEMDQKIWFESLPRLEGGKL